MGTSSPTYHVIQGANQVDILLADGTAVTANVIGSDSYYDLAVLHVDMPDNTLTPLELGDSSQLEVGQTVAAIGNPFGLGRHADDRDHQRAGAAVGNFGGRADRAGNPD